MLELLLVTVVLVAATVAILVPNKEFITGRLLNWSLSDQTTRLVLSVGLSYGSPVREAMNLLKEAAKENQDVLGDPAPTVIFETFGDNSPGPVAALLRRLGRAAVSGHECAGRGHQRQVQRRRYHHRLPAAQKLWSVPVFLSR